MTSQYQLYQKTMEGFLASLDRLGEQPGRSFHAAAFGGSSSQSSSHRINGRNLAQVKQPAPLLGDREVQILEDAVADIEQLLQKRQPNLP